MCDVLNFLKLYESKLIIPSAGIVLRSTVGKKCVHDMSPFCLQNSADLLSLTQPHDIIACPDRHTMDSWHQPYMDSLQCC